MFINGFVCHQEEKNACNRMLLQKNGIFCLCLSISLSICMCVFVLRGRRSVACWKVCFFTSCLCVRVLVVFCVCLCWSLCVCVCVSLNDGTKILTKTDTETFFLIPNFPKPRLFFQDQILQNRNRDFFSETKFSDTETETFKKLAKVSKPRIFETETFLLLTFI